MTSEEAAEAQELPEGAGCAVHEDAPAIFVCTRCGTFGCEACIFSSVEKREVCRTCAAKGLGEPIPWERRKELGWWVAFWQTSRLASRSPSAFFRTPTTDRSIVNAVVHGTLSYIVGLFLTYCVLGLSMMIGGGAASLVMDDQETAGPIAAMFGAYGCAIFGIGPFGALMYIPSALLGIIVAAAATHGLLAVFKKTNGTFEDTLRAVSYANAPYVWSWIPLIGGLVSYVWMISVEVIALRETHRCGTDWAIAAALWYRIVLALAVVLIYVVLIGGAILAGRAGGG